MWVLARRREARVADRRRQRDYSDVAPHGVQYGQYTENDRRVITCYTNIAYVDRVRAEATAAARLLNPHTIYGMANEVYDIDRPITPPPPSVRHSAPVVRVAKGGAVAVRTSLYDDDDYAREDTIDMMSSSDDDDVVVAAREDTIEMMSSSSDDDAIVAAREDSIEMMSSSSDDDAPAVGPPNDSREEFVVATETDERIVDEMALEISTIEANINALIIHNSDRRVSNEPSGDEVDNGYEAGDERGGDESGEECERVSEEAAGDYEDELERELLLEFEQRYEAPAAVKVVTEIAVQHIVCRVSSIQDADLALSDTDSSDLSEVQEPDCHVSSILVEELAIRITDTSGVSEVQEPDKHVPSVLVEDLVLSSTDSSDLSEVQEPDCHVSSILVEDLAIRNTDTSEVSEVQEPARQVPSIIIEDLALSSSDSSDLSEVETLSSTDTSSSDDFENVREDVDDTVRVSVICTRSL